MEYTGKYHAEALIEILESGDACNLCPRDDAHNKEFENIIDKQDDPIKERKKICMKCCAFIGIIHSTPGPLCPCVRLGRKEATKRSWIALEEKGYLNGE